MMTTMMAPTVEVSELAQLDIVLRQPSFNCYPMMLAISTHSPCLLADAIVAMTRARL
jgi:hypothetical protein